MGFRSSIRVLSIFSLIIGAFFPILGCSSGGIPGDSGKFLSQSEMAQICPHPRDQVCNDQGFLVTFLDSEAVESVGTTYTYEVCNQKEEEGEPVDPQCVPTGALTQFDLFLPSLAGCLGAEDNIQIEQTAGSESASLTCNVGSSDAVCDITAEGNLVADCVLDGGEELSQGECVEVTMTVPGDSTPTGATLALTAADGEETCASDCLTGPTCDPAAADAGCFSRGAGFWATHPGDADMFLPITVCGVDLNTVDLDPACQSVTEALCVAPGDETNQNDNGGNNAYASLVRKLAAAKLNLAATDFLAGSCDPSIQDRIDECEALCGADHKTIASSGCLGDLSRFNKSNGALHLPESSEADPEFCLEAIHDGVVIGKGSCNNQ